MIITGAFTGLYGTGCALPDASGGTMFKGFTFDASKSNSIYKDGSTVQPPALCVKMIIKY